MSPDSQVRGTAALALGLDGSSDHRVLQGLLAAIDQGHVEYHVLGAIGRLGGDPDEIGRCRSRVLLRDPGPAPCSVEERMAVCLAGLCGPRAVAAIPGLNRRRLACDASHRVLVERAIQRIVSPDASATATSGDRP